MSRDGGVDSVHDQGVSDFAVLTAAAEISERQQIPTHARATVGTQTRVDWRRFDAASNWAVSSRSEDAS